MGCAHKENQDGFTLVEISIVMIIIGLLIGGTFGGMKLIENMQVNRTVQDLKAIESAALTFKDTYNRLPGDMPNTAARLPSCTTAPCATGGNGDRQISPTGAVTPWNAAIDVTWERFTFWHHLQAAGLLSMDYKNSVDPTFGEGQPTSPLAGGYRISNFSGGAGPCPTLVTNGFINITPDAAILMDNNYVINCGRVRSLDNKIDDDNPYSGKIMTPTTDACTASFVCGSGYTQLNASATGIWYDAAF